MKHMIYNMLPGSNESGRLARTQTVKVFTTTSNLSFGIYNNLKGNYIMRKWPG
jgi:hypothetical protein